MIGKVLPFKAMNSTIYKLSGMIQPFNCPHGRPTLRHIVSFAASCCLTPHHRSFQAD